MAKRKHLPNKRHKGLFVYCHVCKKHFTWTRRFVIKDGKQIKEEPICGKTNGKYSTCDNFPIHKYKSRLHIPGSTGKRAVKTHKASSYDDAVFEAVEFEKEFKGANELIINTQVSAKRHYLIDIQVLYMDFLENIGVPDHKKVERSKDYVDEIEKCITYFNQALKKKNVNFKLILIDKINDIHIGYFHSYLLEDLHHANSTYNKKIGLVKTFFEWAVDEFNLKMTNPFKGIKRRSTTTDNETISKDEFNKLLESISPLTGYVMEGKTKKNRYRDYLKDGFELGLHTGGRREEIIELKWNMIKEVDNQPSYIVIPNFKVLRQKGEGFNDNVKPKIIPITKSLYTLLLRLGYNENKGSHDYVITTNRKPSTKALMDCLSKGFSHYYGLLGTERNLQFKNLRKTYLTYLVSALGTDAKSLSSHSSDEVLQKHYIDQKIVNKAVKELDIFSD